jgi:CDP-glucose 4,6-dehydratase
VVDLTGELTAAFAGRSVFVTGHTGFKGAWLALWLSRLGARVTGYALAPPTEPSAFVAAGVRDVLTAHHEADIRDGAGLAQAMRACAPDVVLHLAAQPLVRASYDQPRETFEVNVVGTASVLDAVRALGRPCAVVVITSDKCYENREHVFGYRETDPLGGLDPYSASKGAAEIVVASYRRSFFPPERVATHGIRLASVRAGNVIGGGDWAQDRIVADAARSLSSGQPVAVRNPRSTRPWQHVLEPLGGYLLLAARMLALPTDARLADAWNFGPSTLESVSVGELVDLFVAAWGSGSWKDQSLGGQPHEAHLLRLSIDKAVTQLGWRPRWSVGEAVRRTALWYRRFYEQSPAIAGAMRASCLADIADYQAAGETPAETPSPSSPPAPSPRAAGRGAG